MNVASAAVSFLLLPLMSQGANYSAKEVVLEGVEAIQLTDAARNTVVTVLPSIGNIGYRMMVNGKNAFWVPYDNLAEMKAKPAQGGAPFLAPWANRIDQDAYYVNGKKYYLNPELANFRRDANQHPIHGLLVFSPLWRVTELRADGHAAWVTSRLEFWKYPDLMAQFPFAHTIEMTYRLADGSLQVQTALHNQSTEPMPVAIGFHPYFQLHDSLRDEWQVHLAAREKFTLSDQLIPTGQRTPLSLPDPLSLKGAQLDDVFGNLKRGADGRAQFSVTGKREKVTVTYGPKYTVAVVYAPPGRNFICFEPMSAETNAFNLAHAGLDKELQSIPAGGEWRESFWVSTSGF
jgi:aldose 1-epimerase